jgi:hypothetical protein
MTGKRRNVELRIFIRTYNDRERAFRDNRLARDFYRRTVGKGHQKCSHEAVIMM